MSHLGEMYADYNIEKFIREAHLDRKGDEELKDESGKLINNIFLKTLSRYFAGAYKIMGN